MSVELKTDMDGKPLIVVTEYDDVGPIEHTMPLAAIASWRELLGIDDPVQVVEAILHVAEHGEPDADPETGENAWTETYHLLRMREQAREDAALEVKGYEGHTDHQVQVAAAQMAYRAVHEPIDGDECALDGCRREARAKLGIPDPEKKCGPESRTEPPPMPERRPKAIRAMKPAGGKAQVLDVLSGEGEYLLGCTQEFLHQLSGHDTDRVTPPLNTQGAQ